MKYFILLFLLISPTYSQDTPSLYSADRDDSSYIDADSTTEEGLSSTYVNESTTEEELTNETYSSSFLYMPAYKTFNYSKFKTKKMPTLISSDGMLKNIDGSYWSLKFYSHPDVSLYSKVDLSFKDNKLSVQTFDFSNNLLENSTHLLSPIKMFKPNEGIFTYSDSNGQLKFIYMHLLLEYLLAVKIVNTYEEAEKLSQQSLTTLGIFTLN